jgi:hypothetical protein
MVHMCQSDTASVRLRRGRVGTQQGQDDGQRCEHRRQHELPIPADNMRRTKINKDNKE